MKRVNHTTAPGISLTRAYGVISEPPIATRASNRSVVGVQTFGLPGPKQNKTILGAYRMGSSELSSGAIYPGEIFPPLPNYDRDYRAVEFVNIGNNVYQPEENSDATHALLKRLGDQKFKAKENEPFAEYFATQKLAKEVDDVARNASLSEAQLARGIMRNLIATRRDANEQEYLRRAIDSGMSAQQASDELESVKKANAMFEAKNISDAPYQSKLLLSKIAKARGINVSINEPLTHSGAIMNPTPSSATAAALGEPGTGFGDSPLDAGRLFMTPDFYRRFARRSALTQEESDRTGVINNMIAEGAPESEFISYPAQLTGLQRLSQIEMARSEVAARLDNLRNIGRKIMLPAVPLIVFGGDYFDSALSDTPYERAVDSKKDVRYISKLPQDMTQNELLAALNMKVVSEGTKFIGKVVDQFRIFAPRLKTASPGTHFRVNALKVLDFDPVTIPAFISSLPAIDAPTMTQIIEKIQSGPETQDVEEFLVSIESFEDSIPTSGEISEISLTRRKTTRGTRRRRRGEDVDEKEPEEGFNIGGSNAVGGGGGSMLLDKGKRVFEGQELEKYTLKQLKAIATRFNMSNTSSLKNKDMAVNAVFDLLNK